MKSNSKKISFTIGILIIIIVALLAVYTIFNIKEEKIPTVNEEIRSFIGNTQTWDAATDNISESYPKIPWYRVNEEGYLVNFGAPLNFYIPVSDMIPEKPEETVQNFIMEYANLFGITSKKTNIIVNKTKITTNYSTVRFTQTYTDIPVFGTAIIVQINDLGVEYILSDISHNIKHLDSGNISIVPTISKEDAMSIACDLAFQEYNNKSCNETYLGVNYNITTPILTIFDPLVLGATGNIHLVWDVTVYPENSTFYGGQFLIDAHNGELVIKFPLIWDAINRRIRDANNYSNIIGTRRRYEGDGPCGIQEADNAYDIMGDVWNFYWDHFSRDSYHGGGERLRVTINMCKTAYCDRCSPCRPPNAIWDGGLDRIWVGGGLVTDDILGHEFTHGVTNQEIALKGHGESGAIAESFSDIFGEFIDQEYDSHDTTTDNTRWIIGEDSDIIVNWGLTRNMSDPADDNDADVLYDGDWRPTGTNDPDSGGIHHNCGVGNKLCYLLTNGDTFRGYDVYGMGINSIARLYYEVITGNKLGSSSDYHDLFHAMRHAASINGWRTNDINNLYAAGLAVGIAPNPKTIYVDKDNSGAEDGTEDKPFNTLKEAMIEANPYDTLIINEGSYNYEWEFNYVMEIYARGGNVIIRK